MMRGVEGRKRWLMSSRMFLEVSIFRGRLHTFGTLDSALIQEKAGLGAHIEELTKVITARDEI